MDIKGNQTPTKLTDQPTETGFCGSDLTPLQKRDPEWSETKEGVSNGQKVS